MASSGPDLINGTNNDDRLLSGLGGNDTINGLGGNDGLSGGDDNDWLYGGSGNDNLSGGAGTDRLYGGDFSDTLDGGLGDDTLDGGASRVGDIDTARYSSATSGVIVSLSNTASQNTLGAGWDKLIGIENLEGSAYGDTLTTNGFANVLSGGGGDDNLYSDPGGNDTLNGGAGLDSAFNGYYVYWDNIWTKSWMLGWGDNPSTTLKDVETVYLSGQLVTVTRLVMD
jgi:Ca2+-binding RTX toxin-like protein